MTDPTERHARRSRRARAAGLAGTHPLRGQRCCRRGGPRARKLQRHRPANPPQGRHLRAAPPDRLGSASSSAAGSSTVWRPGGWCPCWDPRTSCSRSFAGTRSAERFRTATGETSSRCCALLERSSTTRTSMRLRARRALGGCSSAHDEERRSVDGRGTGCGRDQVGAPGQATSDGSGSRRKCSIRASFCETST